MGGEKQPSLVNRQRAPRLQASNSIEQPPRLGEVAKEPRRSLQHTQRPDKIIAHLLDRPIAFQRAFVRLRVGVSGALMLSQAVYWSSRSDSKKGWFHKKQSGWEDETGLTRSEQETARKRLCALGVLEEALRGAPAKLFFRVNFDRLLEELEKLETPPPVCRIPANKDVGIPQARMQKSRKQVSRNPASKSEETLQSPNKETETTTETTTESNSATAQTIPGVAEELVREWKAVRKEKRAGPISKTVMDAICREAGKAGISAEQAIRHCVESGWAGFNASWYSRLALPNSSTHQTPLKHAAAAATIFDGAWEDHDG